MAEKEPWDKKIYNAMREESEMSRSGGKGKAKATNKKSLTSRALTFTLVTVFLLVGFMIAFILWNNQTQHSGGFAQENSEKKVEYTTEQQTEQITEEKTAESTPVPPVPTEESSTEAGSTYTIVAGDDPSTIAAKTGISWSVIAGLNNISATGYNADGSPISPGQVLKLK